ncbi:MAG: VWA domain-containing protein [Acidobacteria bacterium]|nr:VWA domain-containing protein [Acidobacteriota bacterium]
MSKFSAWISIVLLIFPAALFGQEEPQQPKFGVQVNLVSLDVEVLDREGNLIQGLARSDFILEENGKQKEITNFSLSTDRPLSLATVLDTSSITTGQLGICKEFLLLFFHKLDHADEICLYSFDARDAYLEQDLTADRPLLMRALENIGVPSKRPSGILIDLFDTQPMTGLAIDRALLKLREGRNPKKVLLLISNRFRGLGPATVEHVQQSGHTLATLAFPHKATMIVSLGGDEISSRQLQKQSGGRRFSIKTKDIARLGQQVVSSLKNYYSIGYLTEIKAGDKKSRKIRIRIPGHKCAIHFRRTYIPD